MSELHDEINNYGKQIPPIKSAGKEVKKGPSSFNFQDEIKNKLRERRKHIGNSSDED